MFIYNNFYVLKNATMPKNNPQETEPILKEWWSTEWQVDIEQPKIKSALDETLSKEKVYGEYPGLLNPKFIEAFCGDSNDIRSEIAIFNEYYNETLWRYNFMRVLPGGIDVIPHNEENWKLFDEAEYSVQFLIKQTWKFGVNIAKYGEWMHKWKYICDDTFKSWYNYWSAFFDGLQKDKKKFEAFDDAFAKWEDLYSFLPETKRNGEKWEKTEQYEIIWDQ